MRALMRSQIDKASLRKCSAFYYLSARTLEGRATNQPPHVTDERVRASPGHVTRRYRRAPRRPAATQLPVKACTGRLRVQLCQEVCSGAPEGRGTAGSKIHLKRVQQIIWITTHSNTFLTVAE